MKWSINVETVYKVSINVIEDYGTCTESTTTTVMSGGKLLKLIQSLAAEDLYAIVLTENSIALDQCFEIGKYTKITILEEYIPKGLC